VVSEGGETHEWWSLAQETPETAGRGGFQAKDHQKSHECGFIFILCHKNHRKTTFNSGIPHAKFAMMSRWRYADGATTSRRPVQQYAWHHWGSPTTLTQQRKSVLHVCCIWYFYTTPDTTARFFMKYIALVIVHAAGWTLHGREY
jgi:alkylhydroperoxidase family enzyme